MARLNLKALRGFSGKNRGLLPRQDSDSGKWTVSRRSFLQGGFAVAASTIAAPLMMEALVIRREGDSLVVYVEGVEEFAIRPKHFGRKAKLLVDSSAYRTTALLTDAHFPGTPLSAEFEFEIWPTHSGWRIRAALPALQFTSHAYALDWFGGRPLSGSCCRTQILSDQRARLDLRANSMELRPDWSLTFEGPEAAVLLIDQLQLKAAGLTLRPSFSEPSRLLRVPAERKTTIGLIRGDYPWNLAPPPSGSDWSIESDGDFFDQITAEAFETARGAQTLAFLAQRSADRVNPRITSYALPPGLDLRIENLRMGFVPASSQEYAFMADLAETKTPLQVGPLALHLKNPDEGPAVSISCSANKSDAVIKPSCAIKAGFPGIITTKEVVPAFTSLPLSFGKEFFELGAAISDAFKDLLYLWPNGHCLTGTFAIPITRSEDLLDLTLEFRNARIRCEWFGDALIEADDSTKPVVMIAHFPTQSIAEVPFPTGNGDDSNESCIVNQNPIEKQRPIDVRYASPTRLAFQLIPPNSPETQLQLTLDSLLGWTDLDLVRHTPGGSPDPGPTDTETSIEMPYGLVLSPGDNTRFTTRTGLQRNPYTERYGIWFAQLCSVVDPATTIPTVRAIDYRLNYIPGSFDCKVDPIKGFPDLVHLGTTTSPDGDKPVDISVDPLLLTSRGGALTASMHTNRLDARSLTVFKEDITDARETLETLSYAAYLLPTGHNVLLEFTKKRQWCSDSIETYAAYEIETIKIKFLQQTVHYTGLPAIIGRQLPFTSVTCTIPETPTLSFQDASAYIADQGTSQPASDCGISLPGGTGTGCKHPSFYWPTLFGASVKYEFPLECIDQAGKKLTFKMPLMLVMAGLTNDYSTVGDVTYRYNSGSLAGLCPLEPQYNSVPVTACQDGANPAPPDHRVTDFNGQKLAYSPADPDKPGNTSFNTKLFAFKVLNLADQTLGPAYAVYPQCNASPDPNCTLQQFFRARIAPWCPIMEDCQLDIESLRQFSANADPSLFKYYDAYLSYGFGGATNTGEILFQSITAPSLAFQANRSGGLVTPNSGVAGISRKVGIVPGNSGRAGADPLLNVATNKFKPSDAFPDDATLLGVIPLNQILPEVDDVLNQLGKIPKLVSQELQDIATVYSNLQNTIQQIQSALSQLKLAGTVDVKTLLAPMLSDLHVTVNCLNTLVRGELSQIPSQVPDKLQNLIQKAQARARVAASDLLSNPDCAGAGTFPQIRDCVIAMAVKSGAAAQVYSALASYEDIADEALFPALATATDFVSTIAASGWIEFANSIYDFIQLISASPSPEALLAGANRIVSAANRVVGQSPSLSAALAAVSTNFNGVNGALTSAKGTIATSINQTITTLKTTEAPRLKDALTNVKTLAAQQATPILLNIDDANAAVDSIVSTTASYLTSINEAATDWQEQWDSAWETVTNIATALSATTEPFVEAINTIQAVLNAIPQQFMVSYQTNPDLQDAPAGSPIFLASRGDQSAQMTISTTVTAYLDPAKSPTVDVSATVNDFTVLLFPGTEFLSVGFNELSFNAANNQKPSVRASVSPTDIELLGPLNFVESLESFISLPDGSGPNIQVTPTGVFAGVTVSIPDIDSGAFTLSGISFSAGISLSFVGEPVLVSFSFAESSQHFLMAYGPYAGGGFVGLQVGLDGIRSLQGALEAGAAIDLDLFVASGDVYAFAGFYFDSAPQMTTFQGYVRMGGELNILDVVSMSLEFFLGLAYENRGGQAWMVGDCILTEEIDILFFSASVDLHVHREFSGQKAA